MVWQTCLASFFNTSHLSSPQHPYRRSKWFQFDRTLHLHCRNIFLYQKFVYISYDGLRWQLHWSNVESTQIYTTVPGIVKLLCFVIISFCSVVCFLLSYLAHRLIQADVVEHLPIVYKHNQKTEIISIRREVMSIPQKLLNHL